MSYSGHITSKDNPRIIDVRNLQHDTRHSSGVFLVEGYRLVQTAVKISYPLKEMYVSDAFAASHAAQLEAWSGVQVTTWLVSDAVFKTISDTQTPQGVVAIAELPVSHLDFKDTDTLLLVDNLRDPGNLGTILRTAQAAGMDGVLLSTGCVDAYAPKVVRSAMGAHFTLPITQRLAWEDLAVHLKNRTCILADAKANQLYWEIDWTQPLILIISNEAFGASPEARQLANHSVRLPMAPDIESLNAAVAASVLMYEIIRQRTLAGMNA